MSHFCFLTRLRIEHIFSLIQLFKDFLKVTIYFECKEDSWVQTAVWDKPEHMVTLDMSWNATLNEILGSNVNG